MTNREIAGILNDIAEFLEIQNVPFKPRAYQKAAQAIESLGTELSETYQLCGEKCLMDVPGIGESIADKIVELLKTGHLNYYDQLRKKFPFDMHGLTQIEGLGPKTAFKLYQKLKIKTVRDLERAAKAGKIAKLGGFGKKTQANILEALGFLASSKGRLLLGDALPYASKIIEELRKVEGVTHADVAGSIRRRKETIGDIDIIATTSKPAKLIEAFKHLPEVSKVVEQGETHMAVKYKLGLNGDLLILKPNEYGAGLLHFTGSKYHNIQIRTLAMKKGWKLSENGLQKGHTVLAAKTEEEIYKKLGMQWMAPEMREATGEVELALKHKIPTVIPYGSIKGDLQVQTSWTDGTATIEEMVEAARKAGLEYIAITDHTKSLAMTHGLDEQRLAAQGKEIDAINKKLKGAFRVLKGSEVNVLKDGSLDLTDAALAKLDVVGIAVHSNFNMTEEAMTERVIRAMKNPNVDIFFHPTGRLINKRPAYLLNMARVLKAAKQYKVAMEVNSFPDRLDLSDAHIRMAVDLGVKLVIDSDAHAVSHFGFLDYGVSQARRGWATKADVLNTKSVDQFLKGIRK